LKCPVLAIWGERDHYVPVNRSMAVFQECMTAADHKDATLIKIPGASHIMTVPGSRSEFAGNFPRVMMDWLGSRCSVLE